MTAMAAILALMAALAIGLAVKVALSGTRGADILARKAAPERFRHGVSGGLLTSLENIDGRGARMALLLLAATAFAFGAWLALQA